MKYLYSFLLCIGMIFSFFVSGDSLSAQSGEIGCQPEMVEQAILIADSILTNAQQDIENGNTAAALVQLAQVQTNISALFTGCFSDVGQLPAADSESICLAGILCDLFPQAVGGRSFTFVNEQSVPNAMVANVMSEDCARSGQFGLSINYDFFGQGAAGGWGIHWDEVPNASIDISEYVGITFWVRGDIGGEIFQVGLKNARLRETKVESTDL